MKKFSTGLGILGRMPQKQNEVSMEKIGLPNKTLTEYP